MSFSNAESSFDSTGIARMCTDEMWYHHNNECKDMTFISKSTHSNEYWISFWNKEAFDSQVISIIHFKMLLRKAM